jgi:FKBP-type peptidyl-prolyl cis-trans isomerase
MKRKVLGRRGVMVEIFTAGDGINYPKKGQSVTVHYTGVCLFER